MQGAHLILSLDAHDEEERRISAVHDLVPSVLVKGALRLRARQALANDLRLERAPLLHAVRLVVLRQPRLPLLVDHEHEADHLVRAVGVECVSLAALAQARTILVVILA